MSVAKQVRYYFADHSKQFSRLNVNMTDEWGMVDELCKATLTDNNCESWFWQIVYLVEKNHLMAESLLKSAKQSQLAQAYYFWLQLRAETIPLHSDLPEALKAFPYQAMLPFKTRSPKQQAPFNWLTALFIKLGRLEFYSAFCQSELERGQAHCTAPDEALDVLFASVLNVLPAQHELYHQLSRFVKAHCAAAKLMVQDKAQDIYQLSYHLFRAAEVDSYYAFQTLQATKSPEAYYFLGLLYEQGSLFTEQSYKEAKHCYLEAAAYGKKPARQALQRLHTLNLTCAANAESFKPN